MFSLTAWFALSCALTAISYRANGIKTKKGAVLFCLLIFFAPAISGLGVVLVKELVKFGF